MNLSYNKHVLQNGMRLLTVPMQGVGSATVLVMVGAGSRYETKKISGISHFLEHMAFKGTEKRPSSLHISTVVDGIGGEFNAYTSKDHTGFYIKAQVHHIPLLFDVLSDMLRHSLLKADEIEREKGVIVEEINMYEDTPPRKIGDLIEELLFGNHPLGWDIAGTEETVRGITRDDFLSYMGTYYVPNNVVVAVAGGIGAGTSFTEEALKSLTEQSFPDWAAKDFPKPEQWTDGQQKPELLVRYKDTNQAHIALAVRSYPLGHPKRYIVSVLSAILGGGMSSRLFIEVRERRGLAYYVRTGADQYKETGYFGTTAGVDVKRITDAIKVILEQYHGIVDKTLPITDEELQRAKEYIKGRLILSLEDSQDVAAMYAGQEIIEEKIRTVEEITANIDKVTIDEIYDVAKELFVQQKLNLAVIGPYKDSSMFTPTLSL